MSKAKQLFILVDIILVLPSIMIEVASFVMKPRPGNILLDFSLYIGLVLLYCVIKSVLGFLIFIYNIVKKRIRINTRLLLILPTALLSVFFITAALYLHNEVGMTIPSVILAIGLPLWVLNFICGRNKDVHIILALLFTIVTPLSTIISFINVIGYLGV